MPAGAQFCGVCGTAHHPAASPAHAAGWYADYADPSRLRYFDGSAWTRHLSRDGQTWEEGEVPPSAPQPVAAPEPPAAGWGPPPEPAAAGWAAPPEPQAGGWAAHAEPQAGGWGAPPQPAAWGSPVPGQTATRDLKWLYTSFEGRIGRQTYWVLGYLPLTAAYVVAYILLLVAGPFGAILFVLVLLALLYPNLCVTVKRLHDRDRPWWWMFIPIISFIEVGFLEGTRGPNRFGAATEKPGP